MIKSAIKQEEVGWIGMNMENRKINTAFMIYFDQLKTEPTDQELAVVERTRSQAEWTEFKRRQQAEAKRQKKLFADLRDLSGEPRELLP